MQLNDRQRLILSGVLKDHRALINMPTGRDVGLSGDTLGRRRLVVRDAQAGLVPMNLAGWIGHVPTGSECVLYCREYARLEDLGLVKRHNLRGGRRTSHLRLTSAGRWVAEGLLAEEAPIATSEPLDMGDLDMSSLVLPEEAVTETDPSIQPRKGSSEDILKQNTPRDQNDASVDTASCLVQEHGVSAPSMAATAEVTVQGIKVIP